MNKVMYAVLFFLLLGGSATLYSQQSDNVEITLPGSDAVSGFQVLRSDTTLLFRVAGDGSVTIPGMTGTARRAIATPVTGMLVFQNDETIGLYYFDGTEWRTLPLNSVTTGTISNGAVTSVKIADSTIVDADISPTAAITYSKLALTNSITNGDLTANSVTTLKVADGTVTTSKLADSAVSGLKLLTYAVTNRHLADGAVTLAKIDPTGAGSGNVLQYNGTNVVWATGGVVTPNSTLSGTGASGSPLGINLGNSNTWTANQTFGGTFLITANSRIAMTNSDNNARDIRFQEPSGTGSQYIGLRAPSVTNNGNYVLPAVVGSVGQVLTLATSNGIDSATTQWGSPSIAAGSVGTTELADDAVTTAKILDGAVGNADLATNSVTTSKVANGTVTTSKLADSAVSGLKLLTYAVTNRHLASNAVTPDKVDPTGATSGDVLTYNGTSVAWVAGGGGGTVTRNATLTGTGASGSPLGINLGNSNTWTANQTFAGTFLITANSRIAMTNSDNNARDIRFQEPSGTGSQYIGLRAPSVTNNGNYVFPAVVGSVGQVLTLSASNGIDSASMAWTTPSSSVAAGSIGTTELADNAVTTEKILDGAVGNADLSTNSVTTSKVANGTVTTSKLADSAVSGLKLLTFAVTNRHLASGAVTGDKISYPLSMTAGNFSTALQVSSGRVALSYGEVTAANGGVSITDGPAIVVIRAGASAGFNITLPTGTHNGQLLTIYNSDGNTATVSSGNVLNAQTTIPTGTTREYIWVTTNSTSGWVGQ